MRGDITSCSFRCPCGFFDYGAPAEEAAKAKHPGFVEPACGGCARSSSMATVQVHLANNEFRVPDDLSAL
jgi:hypothetical protein